VQDNEWHQYADLAAYLNGRGVPSIDEALREILLQPVHRAFKDLVSAHMFDLLKPDVDLNGVESKTSSLLRESKLVAHGSGHEVAIAQSVRRKLAAALDLWPRPGEAVSGGPVGEEDKLRAEVLGAPAEEAAAARKAAPVDPVDYLRAQLPGDAATWGTLFGWLFVHDLGRVVSGEDSEQRSRSWIDEWLLGRIVAGALQESGLDELAAWRAVSAIRILTAHQHWFDFEGLGQAPAYQILSDWLKDDEVRRFLHVNRYKDLLWFNQESFGQLLGWMLAVALIALRADDSRPDTGASIRACFETVQALHRAAERSGYQVEKLQEAAKNE